MMPRLTWTASTHRFARASSIASSTYWALGLMRSANSAIACPPEMRRIPYARLKTIVKPVYRLLGITTGALPDACGKPNTLLVGIRRVALIVAGVWARLYKELRLRAIGITRAYTGFGRRIV